MASSSEEEATMTKLVTLGILVLAGSLAAHAGEPVRPAAEREFTLGLVQKEVRVGMSQADVAAAIGSPNIVTRGSDGREVWVYDKVASEARFKSRGIGGGVAGAATPGASLLLGVLGGHAQDESTTTSQRTLTVVVRFDATGRVEVLSYHASRF
jgi:hypothetical protein